MDLETGAGGETALVGELARVDARDAEWLVLDWGGTGEYRVQFELPRAAAAFFEAERDQVGALTLQYNGIDFSGNQMVFYRDNAMDRINMDQAIPVVADGSIRSGTWLFTRLGRDHFELQPLDRTQRAARLAVAALTGGVGRTTKRAYGWA